MLEAYTIIGFIGALVLMVGFIMNQIGRWETSDFEYDFINLIGSAILAIYAWQIGSYPFLVLFIVWGLFSIKDVLVDGVKNFGKKKTVKSEETNKLGDYIEKEKENAAEEANEAKEEEKSE